jgi:very-short-patch-repair endonuclease
MLGGQLNKPFGLRNIDVAIEVEGMEIAVEYDSWYWHAHRQEQDEERDEELLAAGWRVLHVRSNELLPTRAQLEAAIACLVAGEEQTEIVLEDWGQGPTRFEPD